MLKTPPLKGYLPIMKISSNQAKQIPRAVIPLIKADTGFSDDSCSMTSLNAMEMRADKMTNHLDFLTNWNLTPSLVESANVPFMPSNHLAVSVNPCLSIHTKQTSCLLNYFVLKTLCYKTLQSRSVLGEFLGLNLQQILWLSDKVSSHLSLMAFLLVSIRKQCPDNFKGRLLKPNVDNRIGHSTVENQDPYCLVFKSDLNQDY